jgi:crotonobetainyl-CoA:carnitine CoA-transferase CaiB-like acyl-CoA transferase
MGFLDPYRVLDLTDERGLLAGRILADLGADVIQLEPPGGSSARALPPFAGPCDAPGESLYWAAYASNKRGMSCDLDSDEGQRLLLRLAETADFLLESEPPGAMARRGLGYEALSRRNPSLIHVSITPFGGDGPHAGYSESDLVLWAAGGALYPNQQGDAPPLRISVPQAYLHAGADAAGGALVAHFARVRSGLGQHVDVSVQASVAQATLSMVLAAAVSETVDLLSPFVVNSAGQPPQRADLSGSGSRTRRSKWRLREGLAELHLAMGPAAGAATNALFRWIHEERGCDDALAGLDWRSVHERLADGSIQASELERAREVVAAFLAQRTKSEIVDEAIGRKLAIGPVHTVADLVHSPQLRARDFWRSTQVGRRTARLPGPFARTQAAAFRFERDAPSLGEHDRELPDELSRTPQRAPSRFGAAGDLPFAGLRVVDLSWVVAGPVVGRTLADYGATVVRVESSRRVDLARLVGPHADGLEIPESSACYANANAGKLGVAVDLSSEAGRDVVRDLVRWGSVVVESFSPGVMDRWGLGYEALAELRPGLVMLSTSLMGHSGPHAAFAGSGNVGAALAGFQAIAGWPGEMPLGPYGPYTDYVGPRFSLVALLAALDHRRRTGEGAHLDVSQAEAGIQFLAPQILEYELTGRVAGPRGNSDPVMAPHGVYPCLHDERGAPAWVAVAVRSDAEWRALADLLEIARSVAGELAAAHQRIERQAELDGLVTRWTGQRTAARAEEELQSRGIAAHRASSPYDAFADVQLRHREHFVDVPHQLRGSMTVEGSRMRLSRTPAQVRRSGPTIGQDTGQVMREILRYDEARIARLEQAGVLR